jgi:hypothetical protein
MKAKILNALLIISSLFGYLEWGQGQQTFLFQVEADIISKLFSDPQSIIHPFIIFPLFGQVLLFLTLFKKIPQRKMTYIGLLALGILLLFIFFIGLMSLNYKIILSTIPFLLFAVLTVKHLRKL